MEEAFGKKKALVIVTSVNMLRSNASPEKRPTGCNLKELAYLNEHLFKQHPKISWTIASPAGSEIPLDPASARERERDSVLEQFMSDKKIQEMLRNAPALSKIKPKEYSAVFFVGGPGSMLDLPEEEETIRKIIHAVYHKNKGIVASIGHGLAAIVGLQIEEEEDAEEDEYDEEDEANNGEEAEDAEKKKKYQESSAQSQRQNPSSCQSCEGGGKPKPKSESKKKKAFIYDREVTGMTKDEEEEQGLKEFLPFSLEDRAPENGAKFIKKPKFTPHVVVSERLVTAQNEQSTSLWIQKVIETCRSEQAKKPMK